jgi:hypothetical protein
MLVCIPGDIFITGPLASAAAAASQVNNHTPRISSHIKKKGRAAHYMRSAPCDIYPRGVAAVGLLIICWDPLRCLATEMPQIARRF